MTRILFAILATLLSTAVAQASGPIIQVTVTGTAGSHGLRVTVTNTSDQVILMNNGDLPWGTMYSMVVAATELSAAPFPLLPRYRIDDPSPREVTLKPGESVTQSIPLSDRFSTWEVSLKKHDMLIAWTYVPHVQSPQVALDRQSGVLVLQRQR
jgi:hypothetical protein